LGKGAFSRARAREGEKGDIFNILPISD